jgi:hypothetical protein
MRDAHYTDETCARQIFHALDDLDPTRIADFACGDGALLSAALERWPNSVPFAVDIEDLRSNITKRIPNVEFHCADFFSEAMPGPDTIGLFDLIALNPPFTCRGSRTNKVTLDGNQLSCSRAFAFAISSLRYLSNSGVLVAILPMSCLSSLKDREARELLDCNYHSEILPLAKPVKFRACSVSTAVLQLRKRSSTINRVNMPPPQSSFTILRGARPNASAIGASNLPAFIHTTELRNHSVSVLRRPGAHSRDREITGPAIVIPRVGRPRSDKIAFVGDGQVVRISDCVIAITHSDRALVLWAYSQLTADPVAFEALYSGTCAPYLTIDRLRDHLGVLEHHLKRAA